MEKMFSLFPSLPHRSCFVRHFTPHLLTKEWEEKEEKRVLKLVDRSKSHFLVRSKGSSGERASGKGATFNNGDFTTDSPPAAMMTVPILPNERTDSGSGRPNSIAFVIWQREGEEEARREERTVTLRLTARGQ